MWLGIRAVRPGARLGDIGATIQKFVEASHCSVVREYCGHGIGRGFHEDPQVLHYGTAGTGLELEAGMTFTIEPMVNAGRRDVRLLPDGWTVITRDDGSKQWAYQGKPLYTWLKDTKPGDRTGDGVNNAWRVARP